MTPDQKRAAGRGAVGYVRVSSRGQRDTWSPEEQEAVIRDWCHLHQIRLIAVVRCAIGWESGAQEFEQRAGWQEVETHLGTGTVGWLVAVAVDRLSRSLEQLAERVDRWEDQDIAVIIPSLSGNDTTGVKRFHLHLMGLLADLERKTLMGRIIPGMRARLEAGLPLGRVPLGYQVIPVGTPDSRGRHAKAFVPDPETAPIVVALFALAITHPSLGNRRLAELAAAHWPQISWSPGRIDSILSNPIYTGTLLGAVAGTQVLKLNNHPAVVSAVDFERVRAIRAQRSDDLTAGFNAVAAESWLGGLVRCGRCQGRVQWRSSPVPGFYECRGNAPIADTTTTSIDCPHERSNDPQYPLHGCGLTWTQEIENLVWRALECVIERERSVLGHLGATAIERIPELLDERRATSAATLRMAAQEEARLTESLEAGVLDPERYAAAVRVLAGGRVFAESQLAETDGWTYLARLLAHQDAPGTGPWRWVTLQEALCPTHNGYEEVRRALAERRRILHAIAPTVILHDGSAPHAVGSLDGPGEDPQRGIFTGVTLLQVTAEAAVSPIATALARLLVHSVGHDVEAGLVHAGFTRSREATEDTSAQSEVWNARSDDGAVAMVELRRVDGQPTSTHAHAPAPQKAMPSHRPIRLWLDDIRQMPAAFTHWARTAHEAIALLEQGTVTDISFDHDLGDETVVGSGYVVACQVEQAAHAGTLARMGWAVHSANPVGRQRIEAAMRSADKAWAAAERSEGAHLPDEQRP